jgi:endoglucanase
VSRRDTAKGPTLARVLVCAGVAALLAAGTVAAATSTSVRSSTPRATTGFYAPGPTIGALRQFVRLLAQGRREDALLVLGLAAQPRAVWITGGGTVQTRVRVAQVVHRAKARRQLPVLVAYNIPGRDCAGLSAGGALTTAEYKAWIDAFAAGIGDEQAIVILEPDGLGLLPSSCGGPNPDYPFTDAQRYEELNYAVDRLGAQPGTSVYLDGTHSHWLSVGDIASRLVTAGVLDAQGFFLNVSNFRWTDYEAKYGTWISKCIAFANNPEEGGWRLGHYDWCASQYFSPLGPVNPDDISTWVYTDQWFDANLGNAIPTVHYVVDTSRNGRGPWTPAAAYPDPQDWCNPPGRGAGLRATSETGVALLDAFLWVKVPGESDGQCARGLGPAGTTVDPEWGQIDPPAGEWFPDQALQLARNAVPPLAR